jgi:transketolase
MRKEFVKTVESLLLEDEKTTLLLGDIGVFGFRNSFKNYPERVFNIGILEQSTISLSAGLSLSGLIPIVHTIAPFLVERAFEQLKLDFGYQNLGGNFVSVGSSYDYSALGPTHHCPGDVQVLSTIPNLEIVVPGNSEEFNKIFTQTYKNNKPTYFRLSEYENEKTYNTEFGKGVIIKKGTNATIICFGNILQNVIDATKEMDVTILYYNTINPFDSQLISEHFNENIIVIEPFYKGSTNYKITESLAGYKYKLFNIGIPHNFLYNYGTKKEQDKFLNLDYEGIKKQIEIWLTQ